MEETAAYAIIAEIDSGNVSFSLGICEISTGLGYMVGPPLGGFLFSLGGFACPFFVLGTALLPAGKSHTPQFSHMSHPIFSSI